MNKRKIKKDEKRDRIFTDELAKEMYTKGLGNESWYSIYLVWVMAMVGLS